MSTETGMPELIFSGSKEAQNAASRMFLILRAHGMFMADDAPIRVRKADLVAFLQESDGIGAGDIDAALEANTEVFAIETNDGGEDLVVTTRVGHVPVPAEDGLAHSFAERLMKPEPKPEKPAMPVRERVRVDPSWATFSIAGLEEEEELEEAEELMLSESLAEVEEAEELTLSEPLAEVEEAPAAPAATVERVEEPIAGVPVVETEVAPEPVMETAAEREPVVEETPEPVVEEPAVVEAEAAPEPVEEPTPAPEPVVEEAPAPVAAAPRANLTDLSGYDDETIAAAISDALQSLPHVAHFGDQWANDERVHRLSRGELRRIKDYIEEQEQPLTDETLVQDILGVRPNNPDYPSALFAMNFRLSKERDFEFVGTNQQRFWATTNLPPIGTMLRKPNDIGTDYRFLAEAGTHETVAHRSVTSVDHILTFYEFIHGLLPYDQAMQQLVPAPLVDGQRSAVFTFEIPQTYTTYLVELRYPTPNRGGFFLGLDDFYFDMLVPGAIITISATENDGHYKVEFLDVGEQSNRLLELDDKRSPRYHFRPTTYSCATDDAWVLSEDRFPALAGEKPLADKVRRRNESVVEATFERVGMDDGNGGKLASFEDLLAAVNIERPFTAEMLREVLDALPGVNGDDANGYTYARES